MCHFIHATLPESADVSRVRELAEGYNRRLVLDEIQLEGDVVPRGLSFFSTTHGHCDCGTLVGSHGRRSGRGSDPSDRELAKLRKKGWGEAKIARWVEDRRRTRATSQSTPAPEDWISFFREALSSGATNRIGLILLWSPGARLELLGHWNLPMAEATPDLLLRAEERTLYEFVATRSPFARPPYDD